MKTKYVSAPHVPIASEWWEVRAGDSLARTVHEVELKPVDTGLLDASGTNIYRVEERDRIGFLPGKAASC